MSVQTQTRTPGRQRTHETSFAPERTDAWDDTVNYFTSILTDTDFLSYCSQERIDTETPQSAAFAQGLASYIENLCEVHRADGTMSDSLATRLLILGEFPRYIHQEAALAELKRTKFRDMTRAQRQQKNESLYGVIEYNQLMSEHLYANPRENIIEIGAMTASATGLITPGEVSQTASRHIIALKGARVEAVSRHVLDALVEMAPDGMFSYRTATPEEDAQGADVITIFDGKQLSVDFKASLDGVESEVDGTFREHTAGKDFAIKSWRHDNITVVTARLNPDFTDADLGDTCQLPQDILTRAKLHMMTQLVGAYAEVYPNS
jgi:hypothetical protein